VPDSWLSPLSKDGKLFIQSIHLYQSNGIRKWQVVDISLLISVSEVKYGS